MLKRLATAAIATVTLVGTSASAQTPDDPSGRNLVPGPATFRWSTRHAPSSPGTNAPVVYDPALNVGVAPGTPMRYGAGQPDPHVVAASGVALSGDRAFIIQDNTLAVGARNRATGVMEQIPLPLGPDGARKFGVEFNNPAIKPDIEALSTLSDGRLIAFGSGDRPSAQRVWIVDPKTGTSQMIDATGLYEALGARKDFAGPKLNLEGAVVNGDRVVLLNRGNKPGKDGTPAVNAIGEVPLADVLAGRAPARIDNVREYQLGEIDGVRLTFSDATRGPDGRIHFIASAEGKDGIKGSAIGYIDENGIARYGIVVGPDGKPATKKLEGIAIDPKTGKVVAVDDADTGDASEMYELTRPEDPRNAYRMPGSVTLISKNGAGAIGIDAGPFQDGRWTWAEGRHGRIGMDVLRADGVGRIAVGATTSGIRADAMLQGQATVAGVSGETGIYGASSKDGLTRAQAMGQGRAFVGADGSLVGATHLTTGGVHLLGGAQAFAGAKARGEIGGTVAVCGLAANATGIGEVSYGAGAGALGYFKVDWTKGTVKFGGMADVTVGLGAGAGGAVEVSIEDILRNPKAAALCATEPFRAGAARVAALSNDAVRSLLELLGAGPTGTGTTIARGASTSGSTLDGTYIRATGAAAAGIRR